MFRIILILSCSIFFGQAGTAQIFKSLHQVYELEDSIKTIEFEIFEQDEKEIENWAGNTLMTETQIQLFNASKGILNHYIEKDRYGIELVKEGNALKIVSKDKKREPIKTTEGTSSEIVLIRFYVPDDFVKASDNRWVKKEEDEE